MTSMEEEEVVEVENFHLHRASRGMMAAIEDEGTYIIYASIIEADLWAQEVEDNQLADTVMEEET